MLSETRATTVVSHAWRFSTWLVSAPLKAQPGVLDGVVRVAERAQHPVGDGPQVGTVLFEPLVQPVGVLDGHIPPARSFIAPRPAGPGECDELRVPPAEGLRETTSMGVPAGMTASWARSASWSRMQPWEMAAPVVPIRESS